MQAARETLAVSTMSEQEHQDTHCPESLPCSDAVVAKYCSLWADFERCVGTTRYMRIDPEKCEKCEINCEGCDLILQDPKLEDHEVSLESSGEVSSLVFSSKFGPDYAEIRLYAIEGQ